MLRSMTGFGAAVRLAGGLRAEVEIRTVNSRTFKLVPRVPDALFPRMAEMEAAILAKVTRGSVFLNVRVEPVEPEPTYAVDRRAIREYLRDLRAVQRELNLRGDVTIGTLAGLPGVLRPTAGRSADADTVWAVVGPALQEALGDLVGMRGEEGRAIATALTGRLREIAILLDRAEARVPESVRLYRERLRERIAVLLPEQGAAMDREEFAREVALFADRSDISEELQRMRSHLAQMEECLASDEGAGRKIEFLVQEMFREANTMASKAADAELLRHVLDLKSEVDKVKEQAQNVE